MRSISQIINLVVDGEIATPEQAAALVCEEGREAAAFYNIPVVQAVSNVLEGIDLAIDRMASPLAEKFLLLFSPITKKEND